MCGVTLCVSRGGSMGVWCDTMCVRVRRGVDRCVCGLTRVCVRVRRGMDGCVVWLLAFLAFI